MNTPIDIGGNQWVEVLILRSKKRGRWTAHEMSDRLMVPADSTRRQSFASSEKVIPFSYLEEGVNSGRWLIFVV